jgi:hypothetical protein
MPASLDVALIPLALHSCGVDVVAGSILLGGFVIWILLARYAPHHLGE